MLHKKSLYLVVSITWLVFFYSLPFFLSKETVFRLVREDGFQENATAIWFLLAALSFFYLFFTEKQGCDFYIRKTKKNIFFLLLGMLFVFGCGEEISWGQRIFNIQTPEALKGVNVQKEINLHNLSIFMGDYAGDDTVKKTLRMPGMGKLFKMFWFSYCILIPLLAMVSKRCKKIVNTINLPLVPLSIGLLFLLNHMSGKAVNAILEHEYMVARYVSETKESMSGFLFFIVAIWFINNYTNHGKEHQTS